MVELRTIPPLEYFKIDRAADILGCEIEDILHWNLTGATHLNIIFHETGRRYKLISAETNNIPFNVCEGVNTREDVIGILSEWHAENELNKSIHIFGMTCRDEKMKWIGRGGYSIVDIFIRSTKDPCYDHLEPKREISPFGYFFALIDNKGINHLIKGECVDEFYIGAYLDGVSVADSNFAHFTLSMDGRELLNSLVIEYEEVKKLQYHIVRGKKFDCDASELSPFEKMHKNKRNHHEEKREEIYAAAFYALFNWSDELGVNSEQLQGVAANKITEAICNHSQFLFGSDNPILSREKISKLLGAAINTGKVHKSK
ncbi:MULTISPECIES: hypothetical protein [Aeromonas]|uniref:hypothetical protein n=1 Tax=Aeromonas TaxID=642 RepID=UPI0022E35EC1|nr:hypothetical protein [Aeromonas sp. Y318-1]